MIRAIALISGGLDSIVAARYMQEQGIELVPVNFKIPFYKSYKYVLLAAENLNLELISIDLSYEFLQIILKPKHGFGSNLNPCIDCKILMLNRCRNLMKDFNARFVITGEVLGQRPMSQYKRALLEIEKKANLEGLVLRPLSAKLLPETLPQGQGWVDREKLFDFNGRSRRPQMALAKKLGINEYPTPAGGCLLTDPEFTKRLKELISHKELTLDNIELLKLGRHFRISQNTKLIVGRNEKENQRLEELAKEDDHLFMPKNTPGPTALGRGEFSAELIEVSREITGRYCDRNGKNKVEITHLYLGGVQGMPPRCETV